jgi:hypothetical protein
MPRRRFKIISGHSEARVQEDLEFWVENHIRDPNAQAQFQCCATPEGPWYSVLITWEEK